MQPELNFHAGLEVTELLMACYMSAEEDRVIDWKPAKLDGLYPAPGAEVASGHVVSSSSRTVAFVASGSS